MRSDDEILERCELAAEYGTPTRPFTFRRSDHGGYWVVKGSVYMEAAWRLWTHPIGRTDIRVDGHCGCPPPVDPWITWKTPEGKIIAPYEEKAKWERIVAQGVLTREQMDEHVFATYPGDVGGIASIDTYHIDTEVGLSVFAHTLRGMGYPL